MKLKSFVGMIPIYGVSKPFYDIYHGHEETPVSLEGLLDQVRRLFMRQTVFWKKICKMSKYVAFYFWIQMLGTAPAIAAGWPPTPTSSCWWCSAAWN